MRSRYGVIGLWLICLWLGACTTINSEISKSDRIQSFLDRDVIPIIDVQSTLKQTTRDQDFPAAFVVMDKLGIAQIAFEGKQAAQSDPPVGGYRWSSYINGLNAQYPGYFFLVGNGGNNNNWAKQRDGESSYMAQLEQAINTGEYRLMGELEFRHYVSAVQCKAGKIERDVFVPINSPNGHRVFQLSAQTGVPFVIHYEPEDELIPALESMLRAYPKARVIWAHFGQLRKPELTKGFTLGLIERLLTEHHNLYFDLATGRPNRRYYCHTGTYTPDNGILDTLLWATDGSGDQTDTLKPAYRDLLERFSERFVSAMDYGGNRPEFSQFYRARTDNLRLIMRDLSNSAKHNISYRNAWFLLTGKHWKEKHPPHGGVKTIHIIDAHSQADSASTLTRVIALMNQADVSRTILSARRKLTSTAIADFAEQHAKRITASVRTKGRPYIEALESYYELLQNDINSGRFGAMAELLLFHAQKGDRAKQIVVYPEDKRVQTALRYSQQQGWPLIMHIEFASLQGEIRHKFMRQFEKILSDNPQHPFALIHMGQLNVDEIRRLITKHDNVYFLTSHTNPIAIEASNQPWTAMFQGKVLSPEWRTLVSSYPKRFILAFDNVWPEHWGKYYLEEVHYWRSALADLPPNVAHAIAHENAERLWRLPQSNDNGQTKMPIVAK